MTEKPSILFLWTRNAARSQIERAAPSVSHVDRSPMGRSEAASNGT
jgi:hypothetical protein